jgi:ankyrin repeat protein
MDFTHFHLDALFHRSAFFGDQAGLEYSLELGLDINSCTSLAQSYSVFFTDLTPLMLAAWSTAGATVETLHWLTQHGANPHLRSAAKVNAAWYAIANPSSWWHDPEQHQKHDRLSRLSYVLSLGINLLEEPAWNATGLLTEACNVGDSDCVTLLLEAGMPPNPIACHDDELCSFYDIPLFCAAGSGSGPCVSLLLQGGADLHIRDDWGRTALMYAGSVRVAEILLEAGIDLYASGNEDTGNLDTLDCILNKYSGVSTEPLERAKVATYLIQVGLDIDQNVNQRNTRLWNAAFETNEFVVDFLLKNGANPHLRSFRGATPLHAVCWGTDEPFKTDWQPSQSTIKIIEQLLEAGINVNIADDLGYAPIHEAVFGDGGYLTALRTLLKHHADANAVTNDKTTPLMLAAMAGELECMQTLLSQGADLRRVDSQGKTAADYAIEHYERLLREGNARYWESLEYLLQRAMGCIWLLK